MKFLIKLACAAAVMVSATASVAQDSPEEMAVEMRKGAMLFLASNIGVLGGMAKGDVAYDAAVAGKAATNLVNVAALITPDLWPAGTASGAFEGSHTAAAVWESADDFALKIAALNEGAAAMAAAAGTDLAALQGAMGALGGACGGCHKAYRAEE